MNKNRLLYGGIVVALLITAGVVFFAVSKKKQVPPPVTQSQPSSQDQVVAQNTSVTVDVKKSTSKSNTIVLSVSGLKNITSLEYEVTYESGGLVKGVNSGSKPIDVTGKDTFEREVYMGTCSKNDCKPDPGVKSVSIALSFTDADGAKSSFSKDYPL